MNYDVSMFGRYKFAKGFETYRLQNATLDAS